MKGGKKSMKGGGKAYNEHSAEKRRAQDPAKVVTDAFNRAQKGA